MSELTRRAKRRAVAELEDIVGRRAKAFTPSEEAEVKAASHDGHRPQAR